MFHLQNMRKKERPAAIKQSHKICRKHQGYCVLFFPRIYEKRSIHLCQQIQKHVYSLRSATIHHIRHGTQARGSDISILFVFVLLGETHYSHMRTDFFKSFKSTSKNRQNLNMMVLYLHQVLDQVLIHHTHVPKNVKMN